MYIEFHVSNCITIGLFLSFPADLAHVELEEEGKKKKADYQPIQTVNARLHLRALQSTLSTVVPTIMQGCIIFFFPSPALDFLLKEHSNSKFLS